MKLIADIFNKRFSHWKITLPEEDLNTKHSGRIKHAGWIIQYCFGKDKNGEYMDYYATHRMAPDLHVRIYVDGRKKTLPALCGIRRISKDHVEDKRLEDEYFEYNHKVEMLLKKFL